MAGVFAKLLKIRQLRLKRNAYIIGGIFADFLII